MEGRSCERYYEGRASAPYIYIWLVYTLKAVSVQYSMCV